MVKHLHVKQLTQCALFVALIVVGAYIRIPLPLNDYYTLQLLFVLLAGLFLGAKYGTISVIVYVILGLIGIPVFADGGGFGYILNASFGYLLGFIAGAWIAGWLAEHLRIGVMKRMLISCYAALVAIYGFGLPYKYFVLHYVMKLPITWPVVLAACFPIDLPCDVVLCFLTACLAKKLSSVLSSKFAAVSNI